VADVPEIVIYGASGHSNAIAYALMHGFAPQRVCDVAAFIDDFVGGTGRMLKGRPIISFEEWRRDYAERSCLVGIGDPAAKRRLVEKSRAAGGTFERLYSHMELPFQHVSIGAGSWVAPPIYIGPDTVIGDHVQLMPLCCIGHDVVIGDFVTVCPTSSISGYVIIEEGVFVGTGSHIVNGSAKQPLVIGAGTFLAAGSVVMKSVPPGSKLAGNPARPLREFVRRGL
jgi:sugar O-acyltransferase (sialic acid O-acetyltransferase NeuD family)